LAEEQTEESPERSSKPLVEVKVAGANIDIKGIEKFTGVVDNLIKAVSVTVAVGEQQVASAHPRIGERSSATIKKRGRPG
jgi:hypothetical protein